MAAAALVSGAPFPSLGLAPAQAACVATGGANPTIVCTGIDGDGILEAGPFDSVTIEDGAAVSRGLVGQFSVIEVNGIVTTFRNDGTITGTVVDLGGVDLGGVGSGGFTNTGSITAFGFRPSVLVGGDVDGIFLNSGTMLGVVGLDVQGNLASLTNTNSITGTGLEGIFVFGDVTGTITNTTSGTISGEIGIDIGGTLANLLNSGSISGEDFGVNSNVRIASLTNWGTIEATDTNGVGLGAPSLGSITNYGTISGGLNEGDGVLAFDLEELVNHGLIQGSDDGIDVDGGGPDNSETSVITSLINHGTIRGNDDGIDVGTLTSLVNTGTIAGGTTGGLDNSGIAAAVITNLVNSGTISAGSPNDLGFAIEVRGPLAAATEDTNLTLNAGSTLFGYIDLGGGTNTLNIGPGLSLNSTFDGDIAASTLPNLGNTSGALVAFLDTPGAPDTRQVVAVDRAVFETLDETVFDLLAGVDGALEEEPSSTNGFAAGDVPKDDDRWRLAVFGGYSHEDLSNDPHDVDHWSTGILAGFQLGAFADHSVELFGGVGLSNAEAENDAHELRTLSLFAGLNGWRDLTDYNVRWGLTTGILFNQTERSVANNLVAGGLERAKADYTGFFVSPDFEVSTQVANSFAGADLFSWTVGSFFEPTLALRYTGVFANGYTETGTTNPLTLDSRTLHLGSARGTVTLPFERTFSGGQQATLRLTLGTEFRAQMGDDSLTGTLLGQSVSTSLDEDRFDLAAIAGLDYEQSLSSSLSAFARAETRFEIDGSFGVQAQFGLRGSF